MSQQKPTAASGALLARAHLEPEAFNDFEVWTLDFPWAEAVERFKEDMERVLNRKLEWEESPPFRRLNNFMLACSPTLTHAFENHVYNLEKRFLGRRALAVGTPNNPALLPDTGSIHDMVVIWAARWISQWYNTSNLEAASVCSRFQDAVQVAPRDWRWKRIERPERFVQDLDKEERIGFQAIPSLLATTLHGSGFRLRGGQQERLIEWRKAQGDGGDKTGLFLVSRPFRASFADAEGNSVEGYFAYRLDFRVETQAGRFDENDKLKPWVFLHLSCQRYADEPLIQPNYNRNLSVLAGVHKERREGLTVDNTLVRLTVRSQRDGSYVWDDDLPNLLEAFNARALTSAESVLGAPRKFGNLDARSEWIEDEYYLVHATGLKYGTESQDAGQKQTGRGHDHRIQAGFNLKERGEVVSQAFKGLEGIITPDEPLFPDLVSPKGAKTPLAFRDYAWISDKTRPEMYAPVVLTAIKRALSGGPMHLVLLWREKDTYDLACHYLREIFHVNSLEELPPSVRFSPIFMEDASLIRVLDSNGLRRANNRKEFADQIQKERRAKREAWRAFLRNIRQTLPHDAQNLFALIEIGDSGARKPGRDPQQNIRGVVREACAVEGYGSQMLQTVARKRSVSDAVVSGGLSSESNGEEADYNLDVFTEETKGRVRNAALDVTHRHIGVLYGIPTGLYQWAKLPEQIAEQLDVIALCRRQVSQNKDRSGDVHLALAVRLRATGQVDVLFPNQGEWIPYAQAGPILGKIFVEARKDRIDPRTRQRDGSNSAVKLNNARLAEFAARVTTQAMEAPSLVLVEADVWRNAKGGPIWPQLSNPRLWGKRDVLDFSHLSRYGSYSRNIPGLENLLGVIRIRTGTETPQYVTSRVTWDQTCDAHDFSELSGFVDLSTPDLPHFFSVGRLPIMQKMQNRNTKTANLYQLDAILGDSRYNTHYGAKLAFKHQQMIEMVPFFVRDDLQTIEGKKALCRVPHILRLSPAWSAGNLSSSYPMHLGECLIEDQLCILGVGSKDEGDGDE